MTSLIINMPHLQSRRQRQGAMLFSLLCWAWFIMPLVIVTTWLLGFHIFAQEIVWLGGWRSLVRLAEIAVTIIAGLAGVWILWTLAELRTSGDQHRDTPLASAHVTAKAFGVDRAALAAAIGAKVTTVHFSETGAVAAVVPEVPATRPALVDRDWTPKAAVA
ncbi:MAG: poly-beta-1,6-N-acetyl-D-glucosamine biosynthesis protein PgaD [Sandarakinorhabdus sp.]|nr:poly-beta-1,6-N-acetyl-D-glucosamine biosynthesis protein PgaD [Sandarakinorhabdus sp.]